MKGDALYRDFKKNPNLEVYYKENVPERLHFKKSDRIGPIVVICKEGYSLRSRTGGFFLKGNHGFDNTLQSMRAIFLGMFYFRFI